MNICPACGAVRPEIRLGVRLPPLKARLFDLVKRAGTGGISTADLRLAFDDNRRSSVTIKSHIWQTNELLEDAGYRIQSIDRAYVLVKIGANARAPPAAA
jgi:hypothetical protein